MQALSSLSCQNKKCRDYGKRKANNLSVCGWHGINNHIRLLYCRTCRSRFSETENTTQSKIRSENIVRSLYLDKN
jgi:LacI family transcriptional regulator